MSAESISPPDTGIAGSEERLKADHVPRLARLDTGIEEKYGDKHLFPSFEEGRLRHTNECHATFDMAQPGWSDAPNTKGCLTTPAAPIIKVALHFVDRRVRPSSKEGNKRFLNVLQQTVFSTTPSAPLRNQSIFLMAQPSLLQKEGTAQLVLQFSQVSG